MNMDNDNALDQFGATVKFGTVSASKPGFARVRLTDCNNMRTLWLPILYPKTQDDQACWTYDDGEHVAVLLDAQGEDGVVLGAIYSSVDTPTTTDKAVFIVKFKDGAVLAYNRDTHELNVTGVGKVTVDAATEIVLKAGAKVSVEAPESEFSGNVLVKGQLIYQGGLAGSGGGGSSISGTFAVNGNVSVNGNVNASGSLMDGTGNSNHHSH